MRSAWKPPTSWRPVVRRGREGLIALGLALLCGAVDVHAADDPKRVAFDALSSMLMGDRAAFERATVPTEGRERLLPSSPLTGEARAEREAQLERVRFSSSLPPLFEGEPVEDLDEARVGTRIVYVTQLGGSLVPVVVVRTAQGWQVDPRHWVAEREQQDADVKANVPPMIVKRFLYHLVNGDTGALAPLSYLPDAVEQLTRRNDLPGADRGHVAMLCLEMGVAPARSGEVVRMPSGLRITAGSSADELVYVGMLGTMEVPFRLRKRNGNWTVLPEPYFEWLRGRGAI